MRNLEVTKIIRIADDLRDAILKAQSAEVKNSFLPRWIFYAKTSRESIKEQKVALPTSDGLLFTPMRILSGVSVAVIIQKYFYKPG